MTGRLGQNGRGVFVASRAAESVVAVLAALCLVAAVAVIVRGPDPARQPTFLTQPRSVTLTLADGSSSVPTSRTKVPNGATVRTAPGGSAVLVTAARSVLLGSDTAVTVLDGERERLSQGLVMIDARRAAALELESGAATVTAQRGSVVRVERGLLLRVASFREEAKVRSTGRKATVTVTALHQVQVPYGGLPSRVTALALTRDRWERQLAMSLVDRDIDLNALAAGLASDPETRAAVVVPAALRSTALAAPAELALSYLVAQAVGRDERGSFAKVRQLRDEGGSWGVVAELVGASAVRISDALDTLPAVSAAGGDGDTGGTPADVSPDAGVPDTDSGPSPGPRPTTGPGPRPSPSPSSTPGPLTPVTDPLADVIDAVVSALPTPVASPVRSLLPAPGGTVLPTLPPLPVPLPVPLPPLP